jgi:hypothetical protein
VLVTVASFRDPWEAHMLCSRLEWEGIPASVAHDFHVGNNWPWSTALGGAKVQVPSMFAGDARVVEGQSRDGTYTSELRAQFGDIDDTTCTSYGSSDVRRRRPVGSIIEALLLSTIALVPAFGWTYRCNICGTKWTCY